MTTTHYELIETLYRGTPRATDVVRSIHASRYEAEDAMMDLCAALPPSMSSSPCRIHEIVIYKNGSRCARLVNG